MDAKETIDYLHVAGKLQDVRRFAKSTKIKANYTAGHSWRLTFMVLTIAEQFKVNIDVNKALKISIIHDLSDITVGDIDYRSYVNNPELKKQKNIAENNAMNTLLKGSKNIALWEDFRDSLSKETRFVKLLDRMEAWLTLLENGHEAMDDPAIFIISLDKMIEEFPELMPLLKEIKLRTKKELESVNIKWNKEWDFGL